MQRFEDRKVGRRPGGPGIGREVEQDDRHPLAGALGAPQRHHLRDARGQHADPLAMRQPCRWHGRPRHHLARRSGAGDAAAPAEGDRRDGTVQFRDRHHHGGFDRRQPARVVLPLVQGLEFERMRGEIGHVEPRQHFLRGTGVVVGRPAHQREAGQRHHRVDGAAPVAQEELLDGRTLVEATGKGRHHRQAPGFQRRDHAVVVCGIAGQQVGPHHQQADGAGVPIARQRRDAIDQAPLRARVVQPDIRILHRCGHRQRTRQRARAGRPRSGSPACASGSRGSRPCRPASIAARGNRPGHPARCRG